VHCGTLPNLERTKETEHYMMAGSVVQPKWARASFLVAGPVWLPGQTWGGLFLFLCSCAACPLFLRQLRQFSIICDGRALIVSAQSPSRACLLMQRLHHCCFLGPGRCDGYLFIESMHSPLKCCPLYVACFFFLLGVYMHVSKSACWLEDASSRHIALSLAHPWKKNGS
jgi:hypothetical protein